MAYHNAALLREINQLEGPNGEIVVVVRPNQDHLRQTTLPKSNRCAGFCAVTCCILAFPVVIVGLTLACIGFSRLAHDPSNDAFKIGLIFFFLGLVMCFFLGLALRIRKRDRQKRTRLNGHDPRSTVQAAEEAPVASGVAQDPPTYLQTYRLSRMLREGEYSDWQRRVGCQGRIHPRAQVFDQTTYSSSVPSLHTHRNREAPDPSGNTNISNPEPRVSNFSPIALNQRRDFRQEYYHSSAPALNVQNIAAVRNG